MQVERVGIILQNVVVDSEIAYKAGSEFNIPESKRVGDIEPLSSMLHT